MTYNREQSECLKYSNQHVEKCGHAKRLKVDTAGHYQCLKQTSCRREELLRRSKPQECICYLTSKPYCHSWRRVLHRWRRVDGLKKKEFFFWLAVSFHYLGVPVMEDALKLVFPADGI